MFPMKCIHVRTCPRSIKARSQQDPPGQATPGCGPGDPDGESRTRSDSRTLDLNGLATEIVCPPVVVTVRCRLSRTSIDQWERTATRSLALCGSPRPVQSGPSCTLDAKSGWRSPRNQRRSGDLQFLIREAAIECNSIKKLTGPAWMWPDSVGPATGLGTNRVPTWCGRP